MSKLRPYDGSTVARTNAIRSASRGFAPYWSTSARRSAAAHSAAARLQAPIDVDPLHLDLHPSDLHRAAHSAALVDLGVDAERADRDLHRRRAGPAHDVLERLARGDRAEPAVVVLLG